MALGSYILGAVVKIPAQVIIDDAPYSAEIPTIDKIIKPDGSLVSGLPAAMDVVDLAFATYSYSFTPDSVGDYIVMIKNTINSVEYFNLDNFTVSPVARITSAPRAEPK